MEMEMEDGRRFHLNKGLLDNDIVNTGVAWTKKGGFMDRACAAKAIGRQRKRLQRDALPVRRH